MKASQAVKKYLAPMVKAISDAVTPLGPGTVAVILKDISDEDIKLAVYELPTEIIQGHLDGSEIFYGYTLNPAVLGDAIDVSSELFVDDDRGVSVSISGKTKMSPPKNIIIRIKGDPPDNVPTGQSYNTYTSKFTPSPLDENVIAIIKGRE